jgi:predicted DNA binding CopG/RHH family protein
MIDAPVIYGLTDTSGQIVYVGQTTRGNLRLQAHQRRFSDVSDIVTLQNEFVDETTNEAEQRWIRELTADGLPLRNIVHNSAGKEIKKRLTIDIRESLHRRVKIGCVTRGVEMADVVRELLEKEFPE